MVEEMKEKIDTFVNDLFNEYQSKMGITDGGIDVMDSMELDEIEANMAQLVERVLRQQSSCTRGE